MEMLVLAKVKPEEDYFLAQTCWIDYCGDNIKVKASSRDEAISYLPEYVSKFIEIHGRKHIESCSFDETHVNCPQAFILLPLDAWYCKNTKQNCPIQGWLDMSNKANFFKSCLVQEKVKNGIWGSIVQGKYRGFHHVPGRYLCALCENDNINYNYHYPWELTILSDHCKINEIWHNPERAKQLIKNGFPRSSFGYLCAKCFIKVSKFLPEIKTSEYFIIHYNYPER